MKRILCSFALILVILFLSSCHRIKGSGNIIEEHRDVHGFERVNIGIPAEVSLSQGSEESLSIETDDNILKEIITEVHGKELTIHYRHTNLTNTIKPSRPIRCTLSVAHLSECTIDGSGSIDCRRLTTEDLRVIINGSGTVRIDSLRGDRFDAVINGSGTFTLAGRCDEQSVSIKGSGRFNARNLEGNRVRVEIIGSGRTYVNASERLNVSITGSGDVRYAGSPSISKSITGSGSIRSIGDE
jgi:hypothetical protein